MASLESVKHKVLHLYGKLPWPLRRSLRLGMEAVSLWTSQNGSELGAAIAFYSLFALGPLLIIAIAIAGAVFGPEAARGQIVEQIGSLVGSDAAQTIEKMVASAWRSNSSGFAAVVGVVTLLLGASGVFSELRSALNRIGRVTPDSTTLSAFVRARLIAFALVLGFGFLMVASLLLSAALAAVTKWLSIIFPLLAGVLTLLDLVVSSVVLAVAFWAFLRWLPDKAPSWRAALVGAIASSLLFAVGKHLIGLYLGRVTTTNSFGAAGSLVVVMMWIYYSSQILLFGAAIAWAIDGVRSVQPQAGGAKKDEPQPAAKRRVRLDLHPSR
jgi:membrane protein